MPEEECGGISLISPGSIGLRFIRASLLASGKASRPCDPAPLRAYAGAAADLERLTTNFAGVRGSSQLPRFKLLTALPIAVGGTWR